jgi:hypothetical protein
MTKKIEADELKERLVKHSNWVESSGQEGERLNLSEANLSEADLRGANLSEADLSEANLRRADLWRANLSEADLRGADLRGADLWRANLRRADLWRANLRRADLRGADLRGADLRRADLRRANLRGADLRGADLRGAKIQLSQLIEEQASLAKLPEFLLAHAESKNYRQSDWGQDCGSACCLAGAAGHFLGVNNPAAGILAIRDCFAAVDFDLSVLYGTDADVAKAELKRACLALESKN